MELGVFLPIANNGWIVSTSSPQYMPTFELNRRICWTAEELGFDFVFAMARWRGWGGETEHWDHSLESLSLMSGLAAVTSRLKLFATVHPTTLNPAVAAKMVATLDDISGGRAGVNIATGWDKRELGSFGAWPGDRYVVERYEYAEEWLRVAKELWECGRCSLEGRYFHMDDVQSLPMPARHIPIANAGMSPRGLAFSAQHADVSFVSAPDEETTKRLRTALTEASTDDRPVKLTAVFMVVLGETEAEAQALVERYKAGADLAAIREFMPRSEGAGDSVAQSSEYLQEMAFLVSALVGTPESVARQMQQFSEWGVDAFLLTFPDFIADLEAFGERVLPLLDLPEAGVR